MHAPSKPEAPSRDGFAYPFDLVARGWRQWRDTGAIPDPQALARIPEEWVQDLYLLDILVERARPEIGRKND